VSDRLDRFFPQAMRWPALQRGMGRGFVQLRRKSTPKA
jgi:hypothetical protein